jgi:hypothetical protein
MKKEFTSGQKEILARKLGYDGPMQGFDQYIKSSPALTAKYSTITDKYVQRMAKGGLTRKKYAVGGAVRTDFTKTEQDQIFANAQKLADASGRTREAELFDYAKSQGYSNEQIDQSLGAYLKPGQTQSYVNAVQANTNTAFNAGPATPATPAAATPALQAITPVAPVTAAPTTAAPTPPKAQNLIASSSPQDVAAAYNEFTKLYGGDTQANKEAALDFFRSKGITDEVITSARKLFDSPVSQLEDRITLLETQLTNAKTDAEKAAATAELAAAKTELTQLRSRTTVDAQGKPVAGNASTIQAEQISTNASQDLGTAALSPAAAMLGTAAQADTIQTAGAVTPLTASTMTASAATPAIAAAMQGVAPAQGVLSEEAKVKAAEQAPTSTAVGDVQAAQLAEAQRVQAPADRVAQAGEMITSTGVDRTAAEQAVQQTAASAAQGTVTEDMTVQGQLNKVLANFDAGNPPAWAASTMRSAVAQMSARGLSSSSMAGQAIIQAAMEAAVPIANADAQVFQQLGLQNLSNRQQTAVLASQQRAAFLGQEFDQAFQMRVTNAAKVSDIANMNFSAAQQVALENARMAQTVDLANLGNRQAVVMAEAAQIATLETTNLNNRQQAQVVNAQNFLQMDMANLDNLQQTTLFKSQQITNALLSDTAAQNASKQFNATSQNQTDQFMNSLTAQVSQFNAAQNNAMQQFNTDQANAIVKLNAEAQNARDQFNSTQRLIIDQSNAQWRRDTSTANTAAINSANYLNAQNMQQLTLAEYNNETQLYRDQIQQAFDSYEKAADRITELALGTMGADATQNVAKTKLKSDMFQAVGKLIAVW